MAEEETGFTFVDKRRTVPEAAVPPEPEIAAAASVEVPLSSVSETGTLSETAGQSELDELFGAESANVAPTTYDLIGYCINLLASQAWQKLGLLADPQTGEAQPDLADAKVAIDAVGSLAAQLDNAPDALVPSDLRRDLRTLVNDLRLNYVSQRGSPS